MHDPDAAGATAAPDSLAARLVMLANRALPIEALDAPAFAPFGVVLGDAPAAGAPAFTSPATDFWHAHDFDTGSGGASEFLWVRYRDSGLQVAALEAHWLTEQAIVPLGGRDVLQVLAPSRSDDPRQPDLDRARCFRVRSGLGICMRPGTWHTTFVEAGEVTCLMMTRRSTTRDLVAHLNTGSLETETGFVRFALPA